MSLGTSGVIYINYERYQLNLSIRNKGNLFPPVFCLVYVVNIFSVFELPAALAYIYSALSTRLYSISLGTSRVIYIDYKGDWPDLSIRNKGNLIPPVFRLVHVVDIFGVFKIPVVLAYIYSTLSTTKLSKYQILVLLILQD